MPDALDLLNQRFGLLVAVAEAERNPSGKRQYLCKCDCGNYRVVIATLLHKGKVISCGCVKCTEQRMYSIYRDMLSRCYNPNVKAYKYYGARGITVCPEWKQNYLAFKEWAMSHGYDNNLTIDRIDCTKEYSPDNCRWIPHAENRMAGLYRGLETSKHNGRWVTPEEAAYTREHKDIPVRELAKKFNKCESTIRNVKNGMYKSYEVQ